MTPIYNPNIVVSIFFSIIPNVDSLTSRTFLARVPCYPSEPRNHFVKECSFKLEALCGAEHSAKKEYEGQKLVSIQALALRRAKSRNLS